MQIHDILTLPVIDMNSEGRGICKQDGMVIFVNHAVAGDRIRLQIRAVQKNFAEADCLEILTPSENRVTPACPWYAVCGGCTLGHVTREKELSVKENTVRQALRRMHLDDKPDVFRPILAGKEYGYRNKAVFHADSDGNLGYFARESHEVIPGSFRCRLLPAVFADIAETVQDILHMKAGNLRLQSLYLRRNHENKCTVCLQTESSLTKKLQDQLMEYTRILLSRHGEEIIGVLHCDHPKGKYAVPNYTVLWGERYLHEIFHGLTMRLSPEGFCQVNHEGAEILAETVLSFAEQCAGKENMTAADLYCGSGFFGLHLAKAFPAWYIYGIEINPDSISDAESNRTMNHLENITFFCGDAADFTKKTGTKPQFVVIDPPRAGCSDKMCSQVMDFLPENIVYVSCNPHTLARDLTRFTAAEYEIKTVQPVDMFPGTEHVESVVCLAKCATR